MKMSSVKSVVTSAVKSARKSARPGRKSGRKSKSRSLATQWHKTALAKYTLLKANADVQNAAEAKMKADQLLKDAAEAKVQAEHDAVLAAKHEAELDHARRKREEHLARVKAQVEKAVKMARPKDGFLEMCEREIQKDDVDLKKLVMCDKELR